MNLKRKNNIFFRVIMILFRFHPLTPYGENLQCTESIKLFLTVFISLKLCNQIRLHLRICEKYSGWI